MLFLLQKISVDFRVALYIYIKIHRVLKLRSNVLASDSIWIAAREPNHIVEFYAFHFSTDRRGIGCIKFDR